MESVRTSEKVERDSEHYEDPEKARKVWQAYLPEIKRFCLADKALEILKTTSTSTRLDILLDRLVSISESRLSGRWRVKGCDEKHLGFEAYYLLEKLRETEDPANQS